MSISQAIAPHLPQLRRFARALTGSQKGGDAYVVETLEAIVADPGNLDGGADVRCSLYRLFLKLWNSVAVIIEDEPLIALDLQNVVEDLGHKVVDVARTHREALKAVQYHQPGLILADIQLADGSSGLEAVNEILGAFEVPVIFITAYPERFLTGAPPEPAFLIAKPFSVETLRAVISQVLFFDRKSHRRSTTTPLSASA